MNKNVEDVRFLQYSGSSNDITYVFYTHSDYKDVFDVQNEYIKNIKEEKILLIDKIINNYNVDKVLLYDDKLNYTKRISSVLKRNLVKTKYILFIHDNDIILNSNITQLTNLMDKYGIDRLDLKHKKGVNPILYNKLELRENNDVKDYIYNVNPTIYNVDKFLLLMNSFDLSYRKIEDEVQQFCLKNMKTYSLTTKKIIKTGYFETPDIFIYLHIVHGGKLAGKQVMKKMDSNILAEYISILYKYKFNRPIKNDDEW